MSAVPRLLAGRRRALAGLLVALALGEALAAVLFSAELDHLLAAPRPSLAALGEAGLTAALVGAALLLQRWVGERFAQGYVADCRAALFAAVASQRGAPAADGAQARWLTVMINDMTSLRNYALRGTVRLATSATAAGAAALWALIAMPHLRASLVPLALGAGAIGLLALPLSRAVTAQRRERGRLNRFIVRRIQAELAGEPPRGGFGFRKLAALSHDFSDAAVRRAASAGAMEAAATLAGLAAALTLALVWHAPGAGTQAGAHGWIAGSLTLLGFIAARLLESARALHARIAGRIALERMAERLGAAAASAADAARRRRARRRRERRAQAASDAPRAVTPPPDPLGVLPAPAGASAS